MRNQPGKLLFTIGGHNSVEGQMDGLTAFIGFKNQ